LGSLRILILIGFEILIFSKLENIFFIIFKIIERLQKHKTLRVIFLKILIFEILIEKQMANIVNP
jgi:hypothetical protein